MPMNPRLLRPILSGDPDALRYIAAVQTADQQSLELPVRKAITDFIAGCKADGIWDAIKASCILAGARTLSGALVPLKGPAPTNNGPFVSGDYNRETGLLGDGVNKYLDSNRANNADPQNSNHNAVYATTIAAVNGTFIGSANAVVTASGTNFIGGGTSDNVFTRNRSATGTITDALPAAGLIAVNRSASGTYVRRTGGAEQTISVASAAAVSENIFLYRRGSGATTYGAHRLAFYSIGEALDLAALDTRVSALITALGAAI